MAKKRKNTESDMFSAPTKLYMTNYKHTDHKKKPKTSPYNTIKPLLANCLITISIICILILFSALFPAPKEQQFTTQNDEIKKALSDDYYPVPHFFLNKNYVKNIISQHVASIKLEGIKVEIEQIPQLSQKIVITPQTLKEIETAPVPHDNRFEEFSFTDDTDEVDSSNRPNLFDEKSKQALIDTSPMIVIVIDDMGFSGYKTYGFIDLPAPITLSFLPYVGNLEEKLSASLKNGHEIMVHVPMQTLNPNIDAGPNHFKVSMTEKEIQENYKNTFAKFKYHMGANNHMGSKFMENKKGLRTFLKEFKKEKGYFLDSMTTPNSVGAKVATELNIPFITRDIFLDNVREKNAVTAQLQKLELVALKKGYAVGIGHPYKVTLEALKEWLPAAKENGFLIVPASQLVNYLSTNQQTEKSK